MKIKPASKEELKFYEENIPKGMVPMIMIRTGLSRMKVLYQIEGRAKEQNLECIQAVREILFAVTGLRYEESEFYSEDQ